MRLAIERALGADIARRRLLNGIERPRKGLSRTLKRFLHVLVGGDNPFELWKDANFS